MKFIYFYVLLGLPLYCLDEKVRAVLPNKGKEFITSNPMGQLGNQMYQAAAGISLAYDNGVCYIHPVHPIPSHRYSEIFGDFYMSLYSPIENVYPAPGVSAERTNNFYPITYSRNMKINGYFLSYKYFDHNRDLIVEILGPSIDKIGELKEKHPPVFAEVVVGIHIRTVSECFEYDKGQDVTYARHPSPNIGYLEKAIAYFPEDALLVVCTDNVPWAKKALKQLNRRMYFPDDTFINDFYILSLCDHVIIANSSFSWWAAYLNENKDKKVIAPNPYSYDSSRKLEDTYPAEWILIDRVNDGRVPVYGKDYFWTEKSE